jgi:ribosomal protein S6
LAVNLYEGMFIVDSAKGGSEFPGTVRLIAGMLTRHGAQIDRIEKWSERKFAFPIKQSKRGIYILAYFTVDGSAIQAIREDVGLSEDILRVLILAPHAVSPAVGDIYNAEGELIEAAKAPVTESAFAGTSSSQAPAPAKAPAKGPAADEADESPSDDEEDEDEASSDDDDD